MTDIHSHLLYGVDDGAKTIEESIEILKELEKIGVNNIILTPHYVNNTKYNSSKKKNLERLNKLKKACLDNNIKINLYLGNEIFIDDDIDQLLKKGIISSLNDTKYLLIEIPLSGIHPNYKEIIEDLIYKGYKVILAHPERYIAFQEDFNKIYELEEIGVYFQSNIDSLLGKYGRKVKKTIKRLLKEKKITFLATDIHHQKQDYKKWDLAKKQALKYISLKEYNCLINDNPKKLIS